MRGFHFGDFGHRKERSTTAAMVAIAAAPRARRGELAGSREGAGCGLGLVEEGDEVLTAGGIEPRWPGRGDRRGGVFLGKKTEELGIGARRKTGSGLRSLVSSVVAWSCTRAYL